MVRFVLKKFGELSPDEMYALLKARQDVFVIEQTCIYPDLDMLDQGALHLMGFAPAGSLVAYLRILGPGTRFAEPSLGRILTTLDARGQGLGKELVQQGLRCVAEVHGDSAVRISAQQYLDRFYRELGFASVGKEYLEDGIPHQEMLRPPSAAIDT